MLANWPEVIAAMLPRVQREAAADRDPELRALLDEILAAADKLATGVTKDTTGNRDVKSVLLPAQLITKDKVKTVVDAGFVKASEICGGDLATVCTELGIK